MRAGSRAANALVDTSRANPVDSSYGVRMVAIGVWMLMFAALGAGFVRAGETR